MFIHLLNIFSETISVFSHSSINITEHLEEGNTLSISSYKISPDGKLNCQIHYMEKDRKKLIDSSSLKQPILKTYEEPGTYIFTATNNSPKTIFIELKMSTDKSSGNTADKDIKENLDNVFTALIENHKDSMKIADMKKEIIELARKWKSRVYLLLGLCPLYLLTAYVKSNYMKSLFSTKKRGI